MHIWSPYCTSVITSIYLHDASLLSLLYVFLAQLKKKAQHVALDVVFIDRSATPQWDWHSLSSVVGLHISLSIFNNIKKVIVPRTSPLKFSLNLSLTPSPAHIARYFTHAHTNARTHAHTFTHTVMNTQKH